MLDEFYAALRRGGRRPPLKASTVRQVHAVIRRACRQGVRLAAAIGARRGELCALRWRHVDLEGGVVRIERAIIETGPGKSVWQEKTTKTGNQRKVSLDPETVDVLRRHRATWEDRTAALGLPLLPACYVFSREPDASVPLRPSSVTQAVRRLRDGLGLAGFHLHDARHFHATQLLAAGVPVKTVASRLGHADAATTLRVYARVGGGGRGTMASHICGLTDLLVCG